MTNTIFMVAEPPEATPEMTTQMATSSSFKTPPALSKSSSYENWKKELKAWERLTEVNVKKRGLAVLLSLEGKAKDAILDIDIDLLSADNGVKIITDKLDTLYLKDKAQMAYEAYDKFEKFRRSADMSIKDYVNEFERLLNKTKAYGTSISTDVQAYRLLNSASISEGQKQLVRATIVGDLTYDAMKLKLSRVFEDSTVSFEDTSDAASVINVKSEIINEATAWDSSEETYYGSARGRGGWRGPYNNRGGYGGWRNSSTSGNQNPSSDHNNKPPIRGGYNNRRGKNPLNKRGQVTRCAICGSVNHWVSACSDTQYFQECHSENYDESDAYQVTLFQSNLLTPESMKTFVSESMSGAILDSGATATVAGRTWMDCYVDSLPEDNKNKVSYAESSNSFKFGSGDVYKSLYKVKVPALIGSQSVFIESDVVDTDVPMLLSRSAMKRANTSIDFRDDTVTMLGEKQSVIITSSGHYSLPLTDRHKILNEVDQRNCRITLNVNMQDDLTRIAEKLHSQFSHPPAHRLIKLVQNSSISNKQELIQCIKSVSANCSICREYKAPSPRPVVGLNMATDFNEVVAMDLKFFSGTIILHLIDHVSRFSAAAIVKSKRPEEIIEKIFDIWIRVFGPPKKFFSDNGGGV